MDVYDVSFILVPAYQDFAGVKTGLKKAGCADGPFKPAVPRGCLYI